MFGLDHLAQAVAGDVGVDLGGGDIGVAEQGLHHPQVGAALQQVGGEGVPQDVGADAGGIDAGVGAAVGHANDKYKCDQRGAYWSYNDTVPYRVDSDVYRDDRQAYYSRRRCRLAPAPVNENDYRYVRVCPDSDGRYRVTG